MRERSASARFRRCAGRNAAAPARELFAWGPMFRLAANPNAAARRGRQVLSVQDLTERTGFEPADRGIPGHRFSKPALSTTQPPLQSGRATSSRPATCATLLLPQPAALPRRGTAGKSASAHEGGDRSTRTADCRVFYACGKSRYPWALRWAMLWSGIGSPCAEYSSHVTRLSRRPSVASHRAGCRARLRLGLDADGCAATNRKPQLPGISGCAAPLAVRGFAPRRGTWPLTGLQTVPRIGNCRHALG
jgi:hypothetical protein